MRQFVNFVIRSFSNSLGKIGATAFLLATGVTSERIITYFVNPPWWVTHWGTRAIFVVLAVCCVSWIFYSQSRVEIKIPDLLKRRCILSFGQIADGIGDPPHLGLKREDVMHCLLKAMWRGDFENYKGKSRLFIPGAECGIRCIDGKAFPLAGADTTSDGRDHYRDIDANPPLIMFNREDMLAVIQDDVRHHYPSLSTHLRRKLPWNILKRKVNFNLLCKIRPEEYPQHRNNAYFEKLTMNRASFVRWFSKLRDGAYECDIE